MLAFPTFRRSRNDLFTQNDLGSIFTCLLLATDNSCATLRLSLRLSSLYCYSRHHHTERVVGEEGHSVSISQPPYATPRFSSSPMLAACPSPIWCSAPNCNADAACAQASTLPTGRISRALVPLVAKGSESQFSLVRGPQILIRVDYVTTDSGSSIYAPSGTVNWPCIRNAG